METVADVKRFSHFKNVDYSITDLIECLSQELIPNISVIYSLT